MPGARRIAVALDGGGIERIEVADDGCGMTAAELALAVQRHATSKLADETLVRIATLGFRGEALPSIGAAARLAITSRPRDAPTRLRDPRRGRPGLARSTPCAGPPGTRVVVRDLFFATPARRKFLKHPRTEAEHAEAAVRRLALAAPGVAFRLESDGRADVRSAGAGPRGACRGAARARRRPAALLPVGGERGALSLSGFAGSPALTRARPAAAQMSGGERPAGGRSGAADRGAGRLSRRDRRRGGIRWWRCSSTCRPRSWT